MRKILLVLSEWGYWGEELIGPLEVFDEKGYESIFCTPTGKRPHALPPSMSAGFVDPPLGRVGMTLAEAQKAGRRVLVGKRPMSRVGRAVEKGETQGFIKIMVDADTREILGAAILGVGGDEVVHTILQTMYARQPYTTLKHAMHIHPTVAELVPTVLGDLRPAA